MTHTIDKNYFPGWVRKSITFTIDDGNVPLDKKFLDYVKPAGFRGTFNLCAPLNTLSPEAYRKFYEGFEIANHNYNHANPIRDDQKLEITKEPFDYATADKRYAYLTDEEGVYLVKYDYGWVYVCTDDKYLEFVDRSQRTLEAVFGEGAIRSYVWPNGFHNHTAVTARMKKHGFQSLRAAYVLGDQTVFSFPEDRMNWTFNVNYGNMTEMAEKYEALPDDGTLKFFCFGVHSHDFENAGKQDVLEAFCKKYGNRPETYYSATVGELFDYEDAVNAVVITENGIENPSDIDLYITVDGRRVTLRRHAFYCYKEA